MKHHYTLRCTTLAIFLLSSSQVIAQYNPTNVELQRKLYAQLAAILTVDVQDTQQSGTFLVLNAAGGTLLDPNIDVSDSFQRSILINAIADVRIRESWITSTRPGQMSSIYRAILRDNKTPRYSLTPQEKQEFEGLDQQLYDGVGPRRRESAFLSAYRAAAADLLAATIKVENFKKENPQQSVPLQLSAELRLATSKYNNDAQGPTVRQYLQRHTELQRRRGSAWISDLEDQFERSYNSTENFGEARFYPTYGLWFDSTKTWTKMTISAKDLENRTHNSSSSFTGGISGSWGLWSWGGRYERDEQSGSNQSKASNLRLSFEVLAVQVRYPWLDFGLFESRAWDWSPAAQYFGKPVSDGVYDPSSATADTELMPFVPTTILIARNVQLSADWDFKLDEFFKMRESASGSVGWGPFSFGGRRSRTDETTYTVGRANGNTVSFESPQVIGYFVYRVPKAPDPNPALPWGVKNLEKLQGARLPADPLLEKARKLLE